MHEAISIYFLLYYQLLDAQEIKEKRIRKGTPLVWISIMMHQDFLDFIDGQAGIESLVQSRFQSVHIAVGGKRRY